MDLIDRQAAIDALRTCQTYKFDPLDDRKITLVDAEDVIEALPSTDAVEVVHCKDCYHYDEEHSRCLLNNSEMKPTDYCSYGSK